MRTLEETLHHIRTVDLSPLFAKTNARTAKTVKASPPKLSEAEDKALAARIEHIMTVDLMPLFRKANPVPAPMKEPARPRLGDGAMPAPQATKGGKKRLDRKNEKLYLGNRIALFRTGFGIRVERLAEDAGISVSYLKKLEAGECEPSVFVLRDICRALGTTPNEIMGEVLIDPTLFWRPERELTVLERIEELTETKSRE